ncbi:AdeC/AdeK/OprM family multidrug efflux complex outer membrane factor [Nitrogeniibacter mangrovi]|uniref:AdeC/AdeK/OprM family multidrug efflux complex outer membrane factor n=1 Tax=Nitrogeniibacter mangrovi TaxID=2016596 RepID=A0A6C1B784_9RHOO|nr:AdeC/AdeK/OprM family multidrug efflux complex outer membrane factor [Nitrogeniibacter mangrovi]QID18819.1 AdeC/AdeK/OprM family multidrug efflux complex outer membrane factor [Nitrogeniibacter mangrovi]
MTRLRLLTACLATAGLSACASLAPDYQRPAAPVAAQWPADTTTATAADAPAALDLAWQDYFTDPRLQQVIAQALANNRDLRVAALNIESARAQYRIRRADRFPAVTGEAGETARRTPGDLTSSGNAAVTRQYSVDLGVSWELDLFGRLKSLQDQALESYLATTEAQRATRISLVAEVANAWLTLAADRARYDLSKRTYETQAKSLELTRKSFDLGAASRLALSQLQTTAARARADLAATRAQVAKDRNALELLVGTTVDAGLLPASLAEVKQPVAELPAGVPSEVLTQRPDVLRAERQLRAANANIGAARAAFFPRIGLTGSFGTASASLDGLFESGSRAWSFIPSVSLPIFNAGALRASLDVAKLQRDINVASYEKAIQTAFREVADALADRATIAERVDAVQSLVDSARDGFRLSEARYQSGLDSYLTQLDAQRTLYAAEQELISVRLTEASNKVTLYKVMGGGWH